MTPARPRRAAPVVLGLVLAAYVAMAASTPMPGAVHGDGYYTYLWARTIVFDGDLDFHEDYRICDDPWSLARTPVGDDLNYWNMGPALFWIPILAVERLTSPATQSSIGTIAHGCIGPMAEHAVFGSTIAAWLTVVLGYLIARRHFGEGPALFGAALVGLASSLAYYGTMMLSYGHAASSFSGALFVLAWDRLRARPDLRRWGWLGAAMGLAMLMRAQNVVLAILPAATFVQQIARERSPRAILRAIGQGAVAVVVAALIFAPQVGYWYWITGSPFTVSQGEHYMRWSMPQFWQALFSTGAGLFPWQPATYLCVAGFFALLRRSVSRGLGLAMLALFVIDAYVVSCVYDWWGSVGFPGRRYDLLAAPLMIGAAGLGATLQRWERARPGRMGLAVAAPLVLVLWLANFALSIAIGRAMRADLPRTSIEHLHAYVDEGVAPIWRAIGNPLTWPASIPFALSEGQHARDWDVVGSQELFYHDHQTLSWREQESTLQLAEDRAEAYLAGSFAGTAQVHGRRARVAGSGSARILLPLHWPDAGRLTITAGSMGGGTARLGVTVNRIGLGMHDVPDGQMRPIEIHVPPGATHHGLNDVWLWIEHGPIGIQSVVVRDPDPPPTVEQTERNRELLERRRAARPR